MQIPHNLYTCLFAYHAVVNPYEEFLFACFSCRPRYTQTSTSYVCSLDSWFQSISKKNRNLRNDSPNCWEWCETGFLTHQMHSAPSTLSFPMSVTQCSKLESSRYTLREKCTHWGGTYDGLGYGCRAWVRLLCIGLGHLERELHQRQPKEL